MGGSNACEIDFYLIISSIIIFVFRGAINMTKINYIYAVNVHQGGGRTLLNALLSEATDNTVLFVDNRIKLNSNINSNILINRVKPTLIGRFISELRLLRSVNDDDVVICFGNLPPLFKLRGYTLLYIHNRYLVENVSLGEFPLRIYLRLFLERLWLYKKISHVNNIIIQTPTMMRLLKAKINNFPSIEILPFVAQPYGYRRESISSNVSKNKIYDFVYVASGEPHKNHRRLIEAWCLLAKEGIFPSLCLTLDEARFSKLCCFIAKMRQLHSVNIVNVGVLTHSEVSAVYYKSAAAIYPSQFESFGLPLIEARQAGLPVLASELDFVRDVLDPEQVFDPNSPTSIARAVKRFHGIEESPLPLLDAAQFWASIFRKNV